MDAPALADLGRAARALLAATTSHEPRIYPQVGVALRATVASFSAAPAESAAAIRQLLADDEIRAHGHMQLRELAELVEDLLEHDVDLVLDIYRAAFSWRDTSEETTPLREGVMALSSTRRQDYDGARRALAEAFPKLAAAAPGPAATVLATAVCAYLDEREISPRSRLTIEVMGRSVEFFDDSSAYWDQRGRPRDPQVEMLMAWQAALVAGRRRRDPRGDRRMPCWPGARPGLPAGSPAGRRCTGAGHARRGPRRCARPRGRTGRL